MQAGAALSYIRFEMRVWLLLLCACSRQQEPTGTSNSASQPQPSASVAADAPKEVAWDAPSSWTAGANTSAIRKATYRIPAAGGDPDDTQLTVTTAGGTVDANIERWKGQFKYPDLKRSNMDAHGVKITFAEVRGTYLEGTDPKAGRVLLGAIAETSPDLTFFKMVGPEKTVDAAKTDFFHLVQSIHPK
jgi:hypothetical protein